MEQQFSPDPIYGNIGVPDWFLEIEKFPSIRRMMFLRQLGLKAYIDFPCAIHTRYSHSLGVMELSRKLAILIAEKQKRKSMPRTSENLLANLNNLMAAGLLHDIGHGPFSHVMDYPLSIICGKSHEDMSIDIIKKDMSCLEDHGMSLKAIIDIIKGEHNHPFIYQIVNGPIDADKIDYLLRDSYHVGLKYSFDVDYFINNYVILGDEKDLKTCILGLDYTDKSIITYELFIVIWKSMYQLVYYSDLTRIGESMLEKAILLSNEIDPNFKTNFTDLEKYIVMDDEGLLKELEKIDGKPKEIVKRIRDKNLYVGKLNELLTKNNFDYNELFFRQLTDLKKENISKLADKLSIKICESLSEEKYNIICDIIKTRTPADVHVNLLSEGEPHQIKEFSDIIPAITPKTYIKVYCHPSLSDKYSKEGLKDTFNELVRSWE